MGESEPTVAADRVTWQCSGFMGCRPHRYAGEGPKPLHWRGHLFPGLGVRHTPGGRQPPGPGQR